MARRIRFNAFQMNAASHQSPGLWTHPRDEAQRYTDPDHWIGLAKLLERGIFDGVFLADVLGVYDVFAGNHDAAVRHGVQVPVNDPLALVPLMAQATEHLGFGVTCALTCEHPYPFARRLSTLDHLTRGRVGWNIVTGYLDSAARNMGLAKQLGHDERYDLADEYMEVVYKLWEKSWADDAVVRDKASGTFADPAKVHPIAHHGTHYDVPGIHLCEPSPQRTPVLYQAGTSKRGTAFAARHAECVFISGPTETVLRRYVDAVRTSLVEAGRPAHGTLIYAQALVVVAATEQEARAKHEELLGHIDVEASLVLLSGWTGVDFSRYAHDAPIEHVDTEAGRTALASFTRADPSRRWTVGEAARFIGLGGRGPVIVGSPTQVADELERWVADTGIDGFNLAYALAPDTMRDVVDLVVPELQRRGCYPTSYAAGTLRDKLFERGPRLGPTHAATQVRI
ncbi:LLM class flavin-dependent oxidoreductase [Rhizobacter sp. Root1221]|uniref:LLM class flavin-dependent oxidoreductase n=1 Tax=Rhizobacter sp. Root1221 TaxID=1736433 RepID=UPI0006FBBB91|nr:LLM class flavin-dependent oxidoreductase [Rhizobacter sp. Root1221]KQW02624.1 5,10-methylene tetrahydromethanopterin reductase [Rhizobacter sp. Root1221]